MKGTTTIALILSLAAYAAQADNSSEWTIRAGIHPIQPKPRNHAHMRVSDGAAATVAATRMATERWGVELFTAFPIEHEIALRGGAEVAAMRQLPVTLSLQHRFLDPIGRVHGYAGIGLGYTRFHQERTSGAWTGGELQLESSLGPAVHAGLDLELGRGWSVSIDARWFDIDTQARLNGRGLGTIELDPYAVGMTIARRLE